MDDFPAHSPGLKAANHWWVEGRARASRFLRLARRLWWLPFCTTAVGLAIGALVLYQQKAVFVSSARMMVSGRINFQENAVFSEELANFFGTQVELMKSGEVRNRAMRRVEVVDPQLEATPVALTVSQLPQTSIFILSTTGPDPRYTQKLLDAIMVEYIDTKKQMRSNKSASTQAAIVDEIARVEREMQTGEDKLLDFQKENNVGYLEQEGNSAGSYLATLNRQLADLKTQYQLISSSDIDQVLEKSQTETAGKAAQPVDAYSQAVSGAGLHPEDRYLLAKEQLQILKAAREEAAKVFRPKHPQMVDLDQRISEKETQIASLRSQSRERLQDKRESLKNQIENLESVINDWHDKALSASQRLAEYTRIKGNLDRSKNLYDRLVTSLHDVDVTRNVDQDMVSILERASTAEPVKPGLVRILALGACAGLVLGLGALFFRDQIDDRVAASGDLEARFGHHLLAEIPAESYQGPLEPLQENDPRHAFSEALRALRSSLLYLPFEGERPKTILITSAAPDEGKSTIALNLAITMALADVSVLLVDGDLRRGSLHRWFDQDSEPGLSDLLLARRTLSECIRPTSITNLDLISQGTQVPNPGELFLGENLNQFLRDVHDSYQYVIFDSSPVMAAADTTSLAPKLDALIFILRDAVSSTRLSKKALELLHDRQANVIGMVFNGVSDTHQDYYFYRYPEYYTSQPRGRNAAS